MTPDETRAYQRGYNAGRRGYWPAHLPPLPPEPVLRRFVEAMRSVRDRADSFRATLMPDDAWAVELAALVDEADDAFAALAEWLQRS